MTEDEFIAALDWPNLVMIDVISGRPKIYLVKWRLANDAFRAKAIPELNDNWLAVMRGFLHGPETTLSEVIMRERVAPAPEITLCEQEPGDATRSSVTSTDD